MIYIKPIESQADSMQRLKGYEMMDKQVNSKTFKLPSIELLREVLKTNVKEIITDSWLCSDNVIVFKDDTKYENFINIYELSHKCKEWAFSRKEYFMIESFVTSRSGYCIVKNDLGFIVKEIKADTEQGAIFKACEWILKEGI